MVTSKQSLYLFQIDGLILINLHSLFDIKSRRVHSTKKFNDAPLLTINKTIIKCY